MFDHLTDNLSRALRNISGRGRLTKDNIKETLRNVRIALLEADVALPVVRDFISRVKEKAIGHEVNKSLTPGQELIKIFHNELISVMNGKNHVLNLAVPPPVVILLVGLQGAGKTTSIGKLGKFLRDKHKKKVLIVSADIYRPAAIKQLEILAQQAGIDFFSSKINKKSIDIANLALEEAKLKFYDVLLVDTAGRPYVDELTMNEIKLISNSINPVEILFVVDATIGQNAANAAMTFNKSLSLTGVILTKVDSDTRGGAALSICYLTGKPIKFLGFGEKIDALELFHPERIASRILGMGDVLSLIEDIESKIDHVKVKKLSTKLKKGDSFDLVDFLEQLRQIKSMGSIPNIIGKLPGISRIPANIKANMDDKVIIRMESIINSMTLKERMNPNIIKNSRKRRIAAGCGLKVSDVNQLLKQFNDIQHVMKKMKNSEIIKMLMHSIKRGAVPPT